MKKDDLIVYEINTDNFLKIIGKYYSDIYHKNILVNYDIVIVNDDKLDLKIYFKRINSRGISLITLNYDDILLPLRKYANSLDYELDGFKYCGGIRHVGYYIDEDTPHFDGVRLYLKEKKQEFVKKKIKDWFYGRIIIN